MRLLSYRTKRRDAPGGPARIGVVEEDVDGSVVVDLAAGDAALPTDMVDLIATWNGDRIREAVAAGARIPIAETEIDAPIRPRKNIIAVGRNYHDHAQEFTDSGFDASAGAMVIPEHPVVFTKSPTSVVGPGAPIVLANDPSDSTDYEGELGVVIGSTARGVTKQDALSHVFGYTVVNDVTARTLQSRHVQWFIGKSPDTFCPMGPWITTSDEIHDIRESWLRTRVNGELRQEAPVSDLIFDIETLIETLSAVMTLEPGDVIATGTAKGVGIGFDPPRFLEAGDTVEIAIDGIGTLSNPVV